MYFMFVFLITIVLGGNDGTIQNISGEAIPRIQHHLVNEIEEPSESSSNRRKRLWGTPDPDAKVVALSLAELQDSGTFVCHICDLSFPRIQNLQFHLRTHNVHYKLPEKNVAEMARKKVYVCPNLDCIHHDPTRALSNITAVKKHYKRNHMEKSLRCDNCLRKYALKSDFDAHKKKCGTKNYECSRCGSKYSRIDRFEIHKFECQPQNPVPYELVHKSRTMSEVNDVQVPKILTNSRPSSTSSASNIDQSLKRCNGFKTSGFTGPEQLQPIVQISNSAQQHSLHVDSCAEKSIWDLTYWDMI